MVEADPSEALKFTVRPLKKDAARPNESDRDLNSEVCSTELAVEPIDAVRVTVRPLKIEATKPNESDRDL